MFESQKDKLTEAQLIVLQQTEQNAARVDKLGEAGAKELILKFLSFVEQKNGWIDSGINTGRR
jgi:hypothetical protein